MDGYAFSRGLGHRDSTRAALMAASESKREQAAAACRKLLGGRWRTVRVQQDEFVFQQLLFTVLERGLGVNCKRTSAS